MGRLRKGMAAALFCLALVAGPAQAAAAGCEAQPVAALPLILLNNKALVAVLVNGQPAFFAIDTGGFASAVSETLAARLKLPTYPIRTYIEIRDIGGERANKYARVDNFTMGNLQAKDERYMVADLGPGMDGFIAPDYLRNFDLDFDFAGNRLNLYRPQACAGHPPGAGEFSPIEMDVTEQGHIRVPVTLDGKRFLASLDTGAGSSLVLESAARDLDVRMGAQTGTVRGPAGGTLAVERHEFKSLQIGAFAENAPAMNLVARDHGFDKAPILLGMAQMRGLRLYVSYRERMLYVSRPAAAPAAAPAAPGPPPAGGNVLGPAEAIARAAASQTQAASFSFVVRSTGEADGSLFLDSEADYHDAANLAVDVPDSLRPALRERLGADAPAALRGKRITVTGVPRRVLIRTRTANGGEGSYFQTHIRLDSADQLSVEP